MKKSHPVLLDFEIDKLTKSIENTISGDSFLTEVSLLTNEAAKDITNKAGWLFDWRSDFKLNDREVYKLTVANNPSIIQGLTSLTVKSDHVHMHLIESAPFNRGKDKLYLGVPGNLVAFACKLSFQRGGDGYVSFLAKTQLIDHYAKTLGATRTGGHLMIINTTAALKLINKYFKT